MVESASSLANSATLIPGFLVSCLPYNHRNMDSSRFLGHYFAMLRMKTMKFLSRGRKAARLPFFGN